LSLRRHTLWNLVGNGLPLLAGVFCIPYLLGRLGYEAFGVLTLIWSLIGYFSLFDFGVGRAVTYEIARLQRSSSIKSIPTVLFAGLTLTAFTGLLGGLCTFFLAPVLVFRWLEIAPAWQVDALHAFRIAGIGIVFTTLTSGLRGAQEAFGEFGFANLNKVALGSLMFLMPAVAIHFHGASLSFIAIYLVCARALICMISLIQLRSHLFTKYELKNLGSNMRSLFSFGGWVGVSGIIGPLMIYGDRFFVGALISSALLPMYAIPQEGLQRLLILPTAFTNALLPKIVGLSKQELQNQYWRNLRRVSWIMFSVCLVSAILAYPVLKLWISGDFAQRALPIVLILSVGIWFNSIAMIPYTFLHGIGSTKMTALIHLAELGLYFLLLYALVQWIGLPGAALAWTLRVVLDLLLLQWVVKRELFK
jgi:O-antigen/teichoic acid export membrane protein